MNSGGGGKKLRANHSTQGISSTAKFLVARRSTFYSAYGRGEGGLRKAIHPIEQRIAEGKETEGRRKGRGGGGKQGKRGIDAEVRQEVGRGGKEREEMGVGEGAGDGGRRRAEGKRRGAERRAEDQR